MKFGLDHILPKTIIACGVVTTIAINPWYGYDPINLPKMFTLSVFSGFLLIPLLIEFKKINRKLLIFSFVSLLFLCTLIFSVLFNDSNRSQQVWGTWGRSTGLITYSAFVILMLASAIATSEDFLKLVRVAFERLGYFITFYALLQIMDLDPINWSQKAMVVTLGNINFTSTFLGLVSTAYLARLLLQKTALSQSMFFTIVISINILLILNSRSIQGIAVLLAGFVVLSTFILRQKFGLITANLSMVFSVLIGVIVFVGTMGSGPFSFMRQETVIYRLDYWKTGFNMMMRNPLNGVGVDSYGDYYRRYRELEAVTRTGPQRVTNTAHNVFLDIASGSGVVSVALFLSIFLLSAICIYRGLKDNVRNSEFITFSACWTGFVAFCLISINQIGVGVWGFIFTGIVFGFMCRQERPLRPNEEVLKVRKVEVKSGKTPTIPTDKFAFPASRANKIAFGASTIIACLFATISAVPNVTDARFLKAIRDRNIVRAVDLFDTLGAQDFHKEQVISLLDSQGQFEKALDMAHRLTEKNSNNWFAWVQIIQSEVAKEEDRKLAAEKLLELDPNNDFIKKDIANILSTD